MAGEWWDFGDFNLGGGGGSYDFGDWWSPSDFNLDFNFPSFDFGNFGFDPSQFNLGLDPSFFNFSMPDPLAMPSYSDFMIQGPFGGGQFDRTAFGMPEQMPPSSPQTLSDFGFGGSSAPNMALPEARMAQGSDPITNLMGSDQGQGGMPDFLGRTPWETGGEVPDARSLIGSPLPGGGNYAQPFDPSLNTGLGPEAAGGQPGATGQPSLQDLQRQVLQGQIGKMNEKPGTMDTITKLLAAFGPTALGAAGLGMQAANRPERNPLEDDLLRARIASSGTQDALAKDRLAFEKENAMRMAELQAGMQEAMLESRKPGGQANINALLQGNPQLAALYNALTKQTTGLADSGGSPEFNALIEQIAQVDIAELQKQAQQQIAQAQEMAARQGINPANIIAEIQQRVLQESAKARANARATLIQQLQPGISVFNSVGGLFGSLFQTPSA